MASVKKKAKTDKKNHPGRGGNWLKADIKLKGVAFYNHKNRANNKLQLKDKE